MRDRMGRLSTFPLADGSPWFLALPTQSGKRGNPGVLVASTKRQSDTLLRTGKRLSNEENSHWSLRELEIPKETAAGEDPCSHRHPWGAVHSW